MMDKRSNTRTERCTYCEAALTLLDVGALADACLECRDCDEQPQGISEQSALMPLASMAAAGGHADGRATPAHADAARPT